MSELRIIVIIDPSVGSFPYHLYIAASAKVSCDFFVPLSKDCQSDECWQFRKGGRMNGHAAGLPH
jgi:hypothetical protein